MKTRLSSLGVLAFVMMLAASFASGAAVCANGDAIWNAGIDQAYSCQLGDLLFSNFIVVNNGNDPTPTVTVAQPLLVGTTTLFSFNPHLGSNQDIDFFFTVTVLNGGAP